MDRLAQDPPQELELPEGTVEHPMDALFPPPAQKGGAGPTRGYTVTLVKEEDLGGGAACPTREDEEADEVKQE